MQNVKCVHRVKCVKVRALVAKKRMVDEYRDIVVIASIEQAEEFQ